MTIKELLIEADAIQVGALWSPTGSGKAGCPPAGGKGFYFDGI